MLKIFHKASIVVFVLLVLAAAIAGYLSWQAFEYQNPQAVTIRISKGASVKTIAAQLAEQKVVKNKTFFEFFVRLARKGKTLRAGEYDIAANTTLTGLVDQMIAGKVKLYKLTIPEGFNLQNICALFVKQNISTLDACLEQTRRTALLHEQTNAQTLEGYVFPDTYLYEYDVGPAALIDQAVTLFYKKLGDERVQKAKELDLSLQDLVTFASVIEKETGQEAERPIIAGVFWNRINAGMPLQSDPTVIYGTPNFDGNLTRAHLETDTPYNTYTRGGLPAGPICSPGLASIDAVLNPTQTDYLYFVAKGDGSHYFSETLEEHNRAVTEYQLKIKN